MTAAGVPLDGAETAGDARTGSNADGKANDGSVALRGDLVALLRESVPGAWSIPTVTHAEALADALLKTGWRRVVEDDDTIERLAKAMAEADGWDWGDEPDRDFVGRPMEQDYPAGETRTTEYGAITKPVYRGRARVVVRALREDT